jgi:hypothetical protein
MKNFTKNNFDIYRKDDFLTYAKCPIRGEIFLPDYKPEEKVRLSFIYFLIACSEIYPQFVSILVETERLDLSLYNNALGEIANYFPPVLIVETKREEHNLISAYGQLVQYLHTKKTENGLIFNIKQTYKVTKILDNYECEELFESSEIISFIQTAITNQNKRFEDEVRLFLLAKAGDFESFKKLALKYRRNKRVIFNVIQNGNKYVIEGHFFEFYSDYFKYTRCGYDSKSDDKPSFYNNEFVNLENIVRF